MSIPVIDIFAGPGGLGEGFSSVTEDGKRIFSINLSIEKDVRAHQTLELRAFFREFPIRKVTDDYYSYLSGGITKEDLFKRHPIQAQRAKAEAWHAELGGEKTLDGEIDKRISSKISNVKKWVLIGGPPCQAYSLVGRSRVIGGSDYGRLGIDNYESDIKHTLYRHYLRILAVHQPPVFVMENVKGLLSAKLKGERMFDRILADLRRPSLSYVSDSLGKVEYKLFSLVAPVTDLSGEENDPNNFVVRAEDYGIPQARHRIIIVGVRSDLQRRPKLLEKSLAVSVKDAIGDLPKLRSGLSKNSDSGLEWHEAVASILSLKFMRKSQHSDELENEVLENLEDLETDLGRGGLFIPKSSSPQTHRKWFFDEKLMGICNHETRGHIVTDLHRYFYASVFAQKNMKSPLLEDLPFELLPDHKNAVAALTETKFNDRFRVQVAGRPSTTVVSHIAKDGHYFIHYDPTQCRSLTVREAARLQTFPDNYFFEGPRTEQYKQVGNAVPPLLAKQIAEIVHGLFT